MVQHSAFVQESWSLQWWYKKGILAVVIIISGGHAFLKCTDRITRILPFVFQSENWATGTLKKSQKRTFALFSVLDPHKHSDIMHFHMLNWKGEDLKFQRPIYLSPNLACLFPLQWNFYCYLLLLSHHATSLQCFWPSPALAASLVPSSSRGCQLSTETYSYFFANPFSKIHIYCDTCKLWGD